MYCKILKNATEECRLRLSNLFCFHQIVGHKYYLLTLTFNFILSSTLNYASKTLYYFAALFFANGDFIRRNWIVSVSLYLWSLVRLHAFLHCSLIFVENLCCLPGLRLVVQNNTYVGMFWLILLLFYLHTM